MIDDVVVERRPSNDFTGKACPEDAGQWHPARAHKTAVEIPQALLITGACACQQEPEDQRSDAKQGHAFRYPSSARPSTHTGAETNERADCSRQRSTRSRRWSSSAPRPPDLLCRSYRQSCAPFPRHDRSSRSCANGRAGGPRSRAMRSASGSVRSSGLGSSTSKAMKSIIQERASTHSAGPGSWSGVALNNMASPLI